VCPRLPCLRSQVQRAPPGEQEGEHERGGESGDEVDGRWKHRAFPEGGELVGAEEEPEIPGEDGEEAQEGQQGADPAGPGLGHEHARAPDQTEEHEVVGPHEAEDGAQSDAGEGTRRRGDGDEAPERPDEERGPGQEVGVGEDLHEGEGGHREVHAARGGQIRELEEQPAEAPGAGDESESGHPVRGGHARPGQPAFHPRHEGEGGDEGEEPIGEKGTPPEREGDLAERPPLEVHELHPRARRLEELVSEEEGAVLRLLDVGGVVVEIVDPVEGAGEDPPRGRVQRRSEVEAAGPEGEEERHEQHRPRARHARMLTCARA
jgi:hypothetical protein